MWKVPESKSGISKSESIGQLNVQRIGPKTFGKNSENATDALPQDFRRRMGSRRHSYPS